MCNLDEYTNFLHMPCFKEVGLTNSLLYDIVEQASRGSSFKMIEKCIRPRYQGKHAAKRTQAKMFQQFNKRPRLKPWQKSPNFLDRMERACFSDNLLRDALLANLHQHENLFRCSMGTIHVDTLRINHTFKTVMNVGFAKKKVLAGVEKREWVQQYSAVFFALNADNQVVGWQFCRNLHHVTLQLLLKRFVKRGTVSTVCTDQCCRDRIFLQRIFAPHVKVFLDTFHFKKRLRRALSTKHFGLGPAMMSVKKLWGDNRQWTRKEMISFMDNWGAECHAFGIWTPAVADAVVAAKKHVNNGCFDKHGAGTQGNENLHKHVNRMLPCGRETVELAFAIFSTFLHVRNFLLQQDKALDSCLD